MLPLEGIRVLDFGRVLSAPYGTMMLADLGADVVKVEHPKHGDDTRSFGPPFIRDVSSYFMSINRGKRSIALNLKDSSDRDTALQLMSAADVVVENFRPGVMDKLGLGYEAAFTQNPQVVYCSLSGFGQREPDKPGYDLMMQGLSGIPSITGPISGDPFKCGASIADLVAGSNVTQGILAALFRRERTGKGGYVDVSMMDGMLSLLTYHASAFENAGQLPTRRGNGHPSIHPFQPYRCQDGFLTICVGNDGLFRKFSQALGCPEWADDERFLTNAHRVAHRTVLDELIVPILESRGKLEWRQILQQHGVPADIVATIPEALKQATWAEHPHPDGLSTVRSLIGAYRIDDREMIAERRPPCLGEHRGEVLSEWLGK